MRYWLTVMVLAVSAGLLTGCQTTLYDWGSYQQSVWKTYAPPSGDGADVGKQIDKLAKEIHETEAKAKPGKPPRVPPGKYAHLGYLYAMQGDQISARQNLEAEKRLYPESTRFIDGLIARMP
ncbi:MAG: DUF4810 domain-containing protein [Phycisphaeraceae bacterium]|nr:DUF4810 domain-containing protein [Phycisphaeraceae bacterium]